MLKIRAAIVSVVAVISSLALVVPATAGSVCYDVQANVNGSEVVNEQGCQELPL